jgi:tetratricopeptide (TPR) repeat protein
MEKSVKNNDKAIKPAEKIVKRGQKQFSKSRLLLFRMISILLSFSVLVMFELALRLFGYGHMLKLFVESEKDKSCLEMNQYASSKFFTDEENTTVGYIEPFKKVKEPDTYRIFVLGESTTIGFPYMHNGSFHRWLKYRLMFTFPGKNFEIINLSLTAVNSYTIYDFAQQIIKYEPDAVLIYVGHNEYYGALGVGSTSRMGSNPRLVRTILKFRNLRLFQFLNNTVQYFTRIISGTKINTKEGLMVRMPADKEILFGSKEYYKGISQFDDNMDKTLKILSSHKIPVLISNVVSNEKDLAPFISDTINKENSAIIKYNDASQAFDLGDYKSAKELFIKAKEMDLLRFRAPEAINGEILKLSKKYQGIYYVDSKSYFEEKSPHGIIGNETILEHVHPNLFGYALLSDAFFECMKNNRMISPDWQNALSFQELLKQMPVTIIDSLLGQYTTRFMKNTWPFTNNPVSTESLIKKDTKLDKITNDLFFQAITWNEAIDQLMNIYKNSGNKEGCLKITEALALEYPMVEQSYKSAASFSLRLNDKKRAIFYIGKGFRLNPNYAAAKQLARMCFNVDEPERAKQYLVYMNSSKENQSNLEPIIGISVEIVKLKVALKANPDKIEILKKIAVDYLRIGQFEMARNYVTEAIKIDENNTDSKQLLIKINELARTNPEFQD